jgi:hypothetical protein
MPPTSTALTAGWRSVWSNPDHPIAVLEGAAVGQGVWLEVEIGSRSRSGATHFRAYLVSDELGRTLEPVLHALHHTGTLPLQHWIEVTDYLDRSMVTGGGFVEIPEGIELQIVQGIGALVPAGGQLMLEYDSPSRSVTASALAAGVPPAATPLGGMMFAAGCGVVVRDHGLSAGGRSGRRKLRGFRANNAEHERVHGLVILADLEAFMGWSKDLDWLVQSQTRPIAEAMITTLRGRFQVPDGPMPLAE